MPGKKRTSETIDKRVMIWMSIYESLSQEPREEEEIKLFRRPIVG